VNQLANLWPFALLALAVLGLARIRPRKRKGKRRGSVAQAFIKKTGIGRKETPAEAKARIAEQAKRYKRRGGGDKMPLDVPPPPGPLQALSVRIRARIKASRDEARRKQRERDNPT
jgi:hypothetical protein